MNFRPLRTLFEDLAQSGKRFFRPARGQKIVGHLHAGFEIPGLALGDAQQHRVGFVVTSARGESAADEGARDRQARVHMQGRLRVSAGDLHACDIRFILQQQLGRGEKRFG